MRWPWQRTPEHARYATHESHAHHALTSLSSHAPHTARSRVISRPRVAHAAAEAAAAYHGTAEHVGTLGSAVAGPCAYLVHGKPVPSPASGALMGAMPALTEAAALAAREAGRTPEEVWAEALHIWLEECAPEARDASGAPRSRLRSPSRERTWEEIEGTLRALRAS